MKLHFAIPGDIDTPTGGYIYDRTVMSLLPDAGVEVNHVALPSGFPLPSADELIETAQILGAVPVDSVLLIDGLAFGALPDEVLDVVSAPIVVILHHPLGLETGLDQQVSHDLLASEKAALQHARHIIVTSPSIAEVLPRLFFVPPPPITVAEPGTERAPRAKGGDGRCEIISVGSVIPRKGHDVLVEALEKLRHLDWNAKIIGGDDRDIDFAARVRGMIADAGLEDRIALTGALPKDALFAHYHEADIFALPSRYEGYGMVFAEALARGLPIVAARAGAVPGTVPREAGLLVEPDDAGAFAEALERLITDKGLRDQLAGAAWDHAQGLPRWEDTVRKIVSVIEEVRS
jgi:glycosyltransferase involved in cell wall biosynthesis